MNFSYAFAYVNSAGMNPGKEHSVVETREKFRAIKIIHNIDDRIDFLFLAEFFRLCGLYVGEDTAEKFDPMKELEDQCFDFFICVSEWENFAEKSGMDQINADFGYIVFQQIRLKVLGSDNLKTKIRDLSNKQQEDLLEECLKQIGQRISFVGNSSWRDLFHIYVENNLMICSTSLQYYPKRDSFAVREAGTGMLWAYNELKAKEIMPDSVIKSYVWYARIWCAVKVNDACEYQKKILYFPPQELAEECIMLSEQYPDFSNAKVLLGLCYEHSMDRATEAISAFDKALEYEKGHCYSNAIYYWIGKRYEIYEVRKELARQYYQSAYKAKRKFRNIYKLAMYEKDCNHYEEAEAYFNEIINALKKQLKEHLSDPLELEYAFKAYQQMCVMYFNQCEDATVKYRKVIEYGKAAIAIKDEEIARSSMYVDLYGTEKREEKATAADYQKISCDRMNLDNIYKILFLTYNDLQEFELARMYFDKWNEEVDSEKDR